MQSVLFNIFGGLMTLHALSVLLLYPNMWWSNWFYVFVRKYDGHLFGTFLQVYSVIYALCGIYLIIWLWDWNPILPKELSPEELLRLTNIRRDSMFFGVFCSIFPFLVGREIRLGKKFFIVR